MGDGFHEGFSKQGSKEVRPMAFNHGFALLVGVGEYANTSFDAPVTAQDAAALQELLGDGSVGYPPEQVQLLTGPDASRQGVLTALEKLATKVNEQSTVVLL